MSLFWLGVPGIMSGLGATWARSYAEQLHNPPSTIAVPYVYDAGVIGASGAFNPTGFDKTVEDVADRLIRGAKLAEVVRACGHSHGPMVLITALLRNPQIYLDRLTLIAAAVPDDCEISGLNQLAEREQVAEVDVLYSPRDTVLASFGNVPGYGHLGQMGPRNVSDKLKQVLLQTAYGCDHGGYFAPPLAQTVFAYVTR